MKKIFTITIIACTFRLFAQDIAVEVSQAPVIDGVASESYWNSLDWHEIKYLIVDNVSGTEKALPAASDFSGKYKIAWKGSQLFFLVEVTDDILSYKPFNSSNIPAIFNDENVEIFLDENHSGGAHTKTHNAFAFHISANGNTADQCGCGQAGDYRGNSGDWNGRLFNNMVQSKWTQNGNIYTWEIAVTVYNDTYKDGAANNSGALVTLTPGKILGYGVAYNDNDKPVNTAADNYKRDHMVAGFYVPGDKNGDYFVQGGRNTPWQDASAMGTMQLAAVTGISDVGSEALPAWFNAEENRIYLKQDYKSSTVKVYSMEGRIVNEVAGQEYISVDGLPAGVYIVQAGEKVMKILKADR
jgi:hypothetical protein